MLFYTDNIPTESPTTTPDDDGHDSLSDSAIAGIVVAVLLGIVIVAVVVVLVIVYLWRQYSGNYIQFQMQHCLLLTYTKTVHSTNYQ